MALRSGLGSVGEDRTTWAVLLFLLLGVLAPTVCLLWFMNEAARNQANAARHDVSDAYRGQVRLIRDRIDAVWAARVSALEDKARSGAAADFRQVVTSGTADSVVFLDAGGSPSYPSPPSLPEMDSLAERPDWIAAATLEANHSLVEAAAAYGRIVKGEMDASAAARAVQAQVRCMVRSGDKEAAIRTILQRFSSGRVSLGHDFHQRSIAADARLLSLQLMKPGDPRFPAGAQALAALLNRYEVEMPSAQRLFLMGELHTLAPREELPTFEAERLAAQLVEKGGTRAEAQGLQRTSLPGTWRLNGKRFIALYRDDTLVQELHNLAAAANLSHSVRTAILPPGSPTAAEWVEAGEMFPGWRISYSFLDSRPFDEVAHRRTALYLWVGCLVIVVMTLSGAVVGRIFRRQARLARLKTDLVAAVSHELKTPLASMRLLVDSLLDDEQPDPRKSRDYLELIAKENLRLSRLIENFLAFSRLERNRHRFEFRPVEPGQMVRAAVEAGGERFQSNGCRLEVGIGTGLPAVRADEDAIVTVLLNLLDNAYKYTSAEKHIALRAFSQDGQVVFAVEDNGIGIAGREQRRIFRRFYQVDRRLAREAGGCGLGLSIVEFIVRAHGGTVQVKSQPGEGSTFSVSLPVSAGVGGTA